MRGDEREGITDIQRREQSGLYTSQTSVKYYKRNAEDIEKKCKRMSRPDKQGAQDMKDEHEGEPVRQREQVDGERKWGARRDTGRTSANMSPRIIKGSETENVEQ
jgi:hypothetical protein